MPCLPEQPAAIQVNGQPMAWVPGLTVDAALGSRTGTAEAVATAVNGEFVPRGARAVTVLQPGDQLTVFTAIVGG